MIPEDTTSRIYLPLVLRNWPPLPNTPLLNAVSNSDGDGSYTVSWNAADFAETYVLQEDDNAAFSSPGTRYTGPSTSWSTSGKPNATYYYSVRAENVWGHSDWSNVESVRVGPLSGFWESSSGTVTEFYVTADGASVDDFSVYINVPACGIVDEKITHTSPVPIDNDQFSFGGSFYASGTFHSPTTASGGTGFDYFYIPGCGYVSSNPVSWTATWQNSSQPTSAMSAASGLKAFEPTAAVDNVYTATLAK
jgi:hypothetical protein